MRTMAPRAKLLEKVFNFRVSYGLLCTSVRFLIVLPLDVGRIQSEFYLKSIDIYIARGNQSTGKVPV